MNIFLLGNGFDLNHKFPTSYIDFLHTVKFLADHYTDSMATVADIFGDERIKNKSKNISESFSEYKSFYDKIILDENTMNFLVQKAKENIWFKYFSTAVEKELTWIDFEKEIKRVIIAFRDFFASCNIVFDLSDDIKNPQSKYIISCFDFFYDVKRFGEAVVTDENLMQVLDQYTIEVPIGSGHLESNKSKIISELYSSLCDLAEMLKIYLRLFIDSLSDKIKKEGFSIRNRSYPEIHTVFTLNYTNTIEKFYASEKTSVYHIHGNVDDNIVLGVNPDMYDEFDNMDTSFIRFKKYFQRVFYKTDIGYIDARYKMIEFRQNAPQLVRNTTVYVIGHSLDETDKDIIQEIFDLATNIKIFYHKEEAVGDYIENLVSIYGKTGFDSLRATKNIEFLPHTEGERYTL